MPLGEFQPLDGIGVGEFDAIRLAILIYLMMSFDVGRDFVVQILFAILTPYGISIDTLHVYIACFLSCLPGFGLVLGEEALTKIRVAGDYTLTALGAVICIRDF